MGVLCKLDRSGHGEVAKWGDDAESREAGATAFADLTKRGFAMFDVTRPQEGRKLVAFDPDAGEVIAVPRMVGGITPSMYVCVEGDGEPRIVGSTRLEPSAHVTRARGLLRRLLSADQWREFENEGTITERIGGRQFVIRPGGMIEARSPHHRLGPGHPAVLRIERWCVNPAAVDGDARLLPEDMAIAQLLHLRADPKALRRTANVFRS